MVIILGQGMQDLLCKKHQVDTLFLRKTNRFLFGNANTGHF